MTTNDYRLSLWRRYKVDADESARKELILCFAHVVENAATRLFEKFSTSDLEFDDMLIVGSIALIESLERFEEDYVGQMVTFVVVNITRALEKEISQSLKEREQIEDVPVPLLSPDPLLSTIEKCKSEAILSTVNRLRPREALVIKSRYWEEDVYSVIAKKMGFCTARACQVHEAGLKHLRHGYLGDKLSKWQ